MTYLIAGHPFHSQKEIQQYVQGLRDRYTNFVHFSQEDCDFMTALLQRHEDADQKIGCGVKAMYLKPHPKYKKSPVFWLIRQDGTKTDFSYRMCLRNTPEPKLLKIKAACRTAVDSVVIAFRDQFFAQHPHPVCPYTGEPLTRENAHVDHAPPWIFDVIVTTFLQDMNLQEDEIELGGIHTDGALDTWLADDSLRRQFLDYHNRHMTLRVISQKANTRLGDYSSEDNVTAALKPSRNDDPTIIYSRAWWVANGIAPSQILKKKEGQP